MTWEERRLFFIERAMADAHAVKEEVPGVDPRLVNKRMAALKDGRVEKEVLRRASGYKALATGLLSYLDGDSFSALKNVKEAGEALPDVSVVHALLGSLYALFEVQGFASRLALGVGKSVSILFRANCPVCVR